MLASFLYKYKKLLLFIAIFLFPIYLNAYSLSKKNLPAANDLDFSILTIDVGSGVETRFGHTIINIIDKRTNQSIVLLNWGTFDFAAPNFIGKFLIGKLNYRLSTSSYYSTINHYEENENRRVIEDKINLTNKQKQVFLDKIIWNLQEKNRNFIYDFFYYNCSTIPRDYLDKALEGFIKKKFEHTPPEKLNLREYTREGLQEWRLMPLVIDTILNDTVDNQITAWTEMFHPLKLREYLLTLPQIDDEGKEVPGSKLLSGANVLVEGKSYPPSRSGFELTLIVGAILFFSLISFSVKSIFALRLLWLSLFVLFFFSGMMGSFLSWAWIFSDHKVLPHNVNLWLLWPTDLFLAALAILRVFKPTLTISKSVVRYALFHLFVCCLYILIYLLDGFEQNVENVAQFLAPLYIIALSWLFKHELFIKSTRTS